MKRVKSTLLTAFLLAALPFVAMCLNEASANSLDPNGEYRLVIEGFDWGPATSKVILSMSDSVSTASAAEFNVFVTRKTNHGSIAPEQASGVREVIYAYVSDESGSPVARGRHITLVLAVAPFKPLGSPIQYLHVKSTDRNIWIDYRLTIIHPKTGALWDKESGRSMPLIDKFNLQGKFKFNEKLAFSYAYYAPASAKAKIPLIIWLHGGGEGGTDPTIPLIANRAANYASDEIQSVFEGAYVLVPQCPGAWMDNAQAVVTNGKENDIYNEGLMALIKDFVKSNPRIDAKRVYVGGCSNGGYMSLKLMLLYPDYFAAGFISALAYESQYISDRDIQRIKNAPIWFVHSKDDRTTPPNETVVPVYNRLIAAGAKNVHFTFYDHVTDITGMVGGDQYRYDGHWSWIYVHANQCRTDFDGSPVRVGGRPVSIMEWMAAQKK